MAFDEATVATIVRNQLGDVDAARETRVIWAIPRALDRLARKVAANPKKRHLLITEKADTNLAIVAGQVDISDLMSLGPPIRLLREFIRYGHVWIHPDPDPEYLYPAQWIESSQQNLPQSLAGDYFYYWQEGPNIIHFKTLAGVVDTLSGDVFFECSKIPTLANIETLVELQDDFIEKVIELCVGPESDAAEDNEH